MAYSRILGSSQDPTKLKLRIKSFAAFLLPIVNKLLESQGVDILPSEFDTWLDAVFVVIFGIAQVWGWLRAKFNKPQS